MPTVTALKPQRNGKRVNVYLDDEFGFGIDLDNLVLNGIKIGKEFSGDELNEIVKKAEFQKSFDKLVLFVTLRPRSEKEINFWLKRKQIAEILHGLLKEKIERLGYLNDAHFAKWWIEQRVNFRKKSKKEIKYELLEKGIDRSLIDTLIDQSGIDEERLAKELLDRKHPKNPEQFLLRRGFSWEIVKKLV